MTINRIARRMRFWAAVVGPVLAVATDLHSFGGMTCDSAFAIPGPTLPAGVTIKNATTINTVTGVVAATMSTVNGSLTIRP